MEILPIKDTKKEIDFWLKALSNPNVNETNKELLNKCLEYELNGYIFPSIVPNRTTEININVSKATFKEGITIPDDYIKFTKF